MANGLSQQTRKAILYRNKVKLKIFWPLKDTMNMEENSTTESEKFIHRKGTADGTANET